MFIFRKSLFSIVRPVLVNVEAEVEVTVEAEEEVVAEAEVTAEAEAVTTTAVERVVALLLKCTTPSSINRSHALALFCNKNCQKIVKCFTVIMFF